MCIRDRDDRGSIAESGTEQLSHWQKRRGSFEGEMHAGTGLYNLILEEEKKEKIIQV